MNVCCVWWSYNTTYSSCASSMWQSCGTAWQLKSPCVLAHPALSARSNHRQSSLCRVAVCAAGSAVLIETQEQMKDGADGWNQSMLPNISITKSQTCLSESKVNTMTATEVSDHIQDTFSSRLCSAVNLSKFSRFGGCTIHNTGSVTEEKKATGGGSASDPGPCFPESSQLEYKPPLLQQTPVLPCWWSTPLLTSFAPNRLALPQLLVTQNMVIVHWDLDTGHTFFLISSGLIVMFQTVFFWLTRKIKYLFKYLNKFKSEYWNWKICF